KDVDEFVEVLARVAPKCVIIDATCDGSLRTAIEAARRLTTTPLIVIGGAAASEADYQLADAETPGELCQLIRLALGQPLRATSRTSCTGTVSFSDGSTAALIDVSESGLLARFRPSDPVSIGGDIGLVLDGISEHARVERVRVTAADDSLAGAYHFVEL